MTPTSLDGRVEALDWGALRDGARRPRLRRDRAASHRSRVRDLAGQFDGGRFRSTMDMARHRFGDGRYRYFDPVPGPIAELRRASTATSRRSRTTGSALLRRRRAAVPARARGTARAVRRGRPDAADAADPALRRGRLERAAPGPLRRRLLPVPGRDGPVGAGSTSTAASSSCSSSARAPRAGHT